MNVWAVIRLALISLARNKMRSFLTALGIIIGVGSVVTMVGVGQGAYSSVQTEISKMGTNLIMIMPGSSSQGGARMGAGTMTTLNEADAEAIAADCPSITLVSSVVRTSGPMVFSSQNWTTQVMGVGADYLEIRATKLTAGRFFTSHEIRNGSKICVLGKVVADNLFGSISPVGQTIRIKKMPFEVIGVLEERGQSGPGQDQDDVVLAPFSTIQRRMMGITHINMIVASAVSDKSVDTAKEEISNILRRRHRLTDNQDDDFQIRTQADMAAMASSTLGIITLLLGAIASVSLVVGGIGIMNIMLVSVTERTREIGIRMAIGARGRDILSQFLVESVTLSCVGGFLGICVGMALTRLITALTEWQVYVSIPAMVIAVAFSAAVGIFFGLYPAWKASQLDPIDALRFE
ncbi:MAG TPA: ABC transporter permease [Candidatus Ozemobacteraceae bacterium]|nr:ABC transporter permease [Candidatus Ozemobacteraceae bacterium]